MALEDAFRRIGENIPDMLMEYFDVSNTILAASITSEYMVDSGAKTPEAQALLGPNPASGPGTLRIVTGRLIRSFLNAAEARAGMTGEGIKDIQFSGGQAVMTYGSAVNYAEKHEEGIGVLQRPYFNPAIDATAEEREELLNRMLQEMALREIDKEL